MKHYLIVYVASTMVKSDINGKQFETKQQLTGNTTITASKRIKIDDLGQIVDKITAAQKEQYGLEIFNVVITNIIKL